MNADNMPAGFQSHKILIRCAIILFTFFMSAAHASPSNEVVSDAEKGEPALKRSELKDILQIINNMQAEIDILQLEIKTMNTDTAWFKDKDNDGFGNPKVIQRSFTQPKGFVRNKDDCNDQSKDINPSAKEINDQADNDCDGIINNPPFNIGQYGPSGGFVFHTYDNGRHGYEAARQDIKKNFGETTMFAWGCRGDSANTAPHINLPNKSLLNADIGEGAANSKSIISNCNSNNIGARLADNFISNDGHDDWFLPSIGELNAMYTHLKQNNIGNFSEANYWSSSENLAYTAWFKNFDRGDMIAYYKNLSCKVRPVRQF